MSRISTDIAIIGGGVIGLATALRLRADGREVAVVEPNEPGSGASSGNAGTIADYAIIPVGTPAVLRNFLSLLFDADSPLAIRKAALPTLFPWLARMNPCPTAIATTPDGSPNSFRTLHRRGPSLPTRSARRTF